MTPDAFARKWSALRDEFRAFGVLANAARICDEVLADFNMVMKTEPEAVLTIAEAATRSGYSVGHLGRLVRQGKIPNAGTRGSPRIRAVDLPTRPNTVVAERRPKAYDPATDARSLVNRRKGGGQWPLAGSVVTGGTK